MPVIDSTDSFYIIWRKGTESDPFILINNYSTTIVNRYAILREIPDPKQHVVISGYTEIYENNPTGTNFYVDYNTGLLFFDASQNGNAITPVFYGRGIIMTSASRIFLHNEDPEVITSIQDLIDTSAKSITFHTTSPTSSDGNDGDIWFVYQE